MDEITFIESAILCVANGRRLIDDAEMLELQEPPSSAFALAIIAQEELAKGFLLFLVSRQVIPWNPFVHRAARDHVCKQLLAAVMDHLTPDLDEFLKRSDEWLARHKEHTRLLDVYRKSVDPKEREEIWGRITELNVASDLLEGKVADSINLFRHEKIGRWQSKNWCWEEEPKYDEAAKRLYNGKRDTEKQDALYVQVKKNGSSTELYQRISREKVRFEIDTSNRFVRLLESLLSGDAKAFPDYEKIESSFRVVFANMLEIETGKNERGTS